MPPYFVAVSKTRAEKIANSPEIESEVFGPQEMPRWALGVQADVRRKNLSGEGEKKPVPTKDQLSNFILDAVRAEKQLMVIEADDPKELARIAGRGIKPVN